MVYGVFALHGSLVSMKRYSFGGGKKKPFVFKCVKAMLLFHKEQAFQGHSYSLVSTWSIIELSL